MALGEGRDWLQQGYDWLHVCKDGVMGKAEEFPTDARPDLIEHVEGDPDRPCVNCDSPTVEGAEHQRLCLRCGAKEDEGGGAWRVPAEQLQNITPTNAVKAVLKMPSMHKSALNMLVPHLRHVWMDADGEIHGAVWSPAGERLKQEYMAARKLISGEGDVQIGTGLSKIVAEVNSRGGSWLEAHEAPPFTHMRLDTLRSMMGSDTERPSRARCGSCRERASVHSFRQPIIVENSGVEWSVQLVLICGGCGRHDYYGRDYSNGKDEMLCWLLTDWGEGFKPPQPADRIWR